VPLARVTLAVGALRHTLYDSDGRIVSCGDGPFGQLGDGMSGLAAHSGTPVAVRGLPAGAAVALTSGWGNAGVLMADGDYYDWGYNAGGQVGDGLTADATTAVRVTLAHPVSRVFEGGSFGDNGQTMALQSNGRVWEWGAGDFGQLGDGSPTRFARRPVPDPLVVSQVSSTAHNVAALAKPELWSARRGAASTGS
jgi:alpha-tubulin suppressor-like RCC1 family protein